MRCGAIALALKSVTTMQNILLSSTRLQVEISPCGAELQSIRDSDGTGWLWHGDPAHWERRAPVLFPVIGASPGGQISIGGKFYKMPVHGFAWTSVFHVQEVTPISCCMRLEATQKSRVFFPFSFQFNVSFTLDEANLQVRAEVINLDDKAMPVCVGFHPAFPWPLPGCRADELHVCRLDQDVSPRVRRPDLNGLLLPDSDPSLFAGGVLPVDHAQFERRAIVLEHCAGSTVHYGVPGKPGVEVATWGMPNLGIWSRPDAPFLCIEPWQGMPPFLGASAALEQRPGVATVPPGENHRVGMTLQFGVTL